RLSSVLAALPQNLDGGHRRAAGSRRAPDANGAGGPMNERLLIAEDDADMRDLLQEDLEGAGYETVIAVDGDAALAHLRRARKPIDLIITDVQMPGLKGGPLLQAVREQHSEIPVIVITGFGSVEQAVQMIKAGAFQYLTKPFETAELLQVIDTALDKS